MSKKSIIIIGAGVSGLSAGIYARQHGFDVSIVEKNPRVGGLCTGWYRKNQYIDGCIHWLTGTNENCDLDKMWRNVHAYTSQDDLIYLDSFGTYEYQGVRVPFLKDTKEAERIWLEISPEDKKMIKRFFKMVRDFEKVNSPVFTPPNKLPLTSLIKFGLRVIKVFPSYLKSMNITCEEFADKFKHPALVHAIKQLQPGEGNLFSMLYSYSTITSHSGGVPKGGSVAMINRMNEYYLSLGGKLILNKSVTSVIINDKKATGVILNDNQELTCDYLVSACDTRHFLSDILKDKYLKKEFISRSENRKRYPTPSCAITYISIKDMLHLSTIYSFDVEPFSVGTQKIESILLRNYDYDKSLCPNESVISIMIDQYQDDYDYWDNLYQSDKDEYNKEKDRMAKEVINRIITKFPSLEGKITLLDTFTPLTITRYVNTYKGAYMSFLFTKKNNMYWGNQKVKGLDNVFLASQWMTSPGGLPFAMTNGVWSIQKICQKERIKFLLGDEPSKKIEKEKIG